MSETPTLSSASKRLDAWIKLSTEARRVWLSRADDAIEVLKPFFKPFDMGLRYAGPGKAEVALWRDGKTLDLNAEIELPPFKEEPRGGGAQDEHDDGV